MIIKIARLQEVGLEISKTQILHENINKSGYKNLKNERLCKNERYAHYLQLYCAEQGKLFDYDLREILL
ncbi:hypothetical protein ACM31_00395 [Helicobacter pylori]|nr:hypothetical protein ACM31_00395 [Helicobacter pylori]